MLIATQTETNEKEHGVHDINVGLTVEKAKYIIHDSCGFQPANQKDIKSLRTFINVRVHSEDIAERLHVIWFVFQIVLYLQHTDILGIVSRRIETGRSRLSMRSSSRCSVTLEATYQ